jgi:hypothetical protein
MKRPTFEDGLRALDEAAELAKSIHIDLDDDYLKATAVVENLPDNQAGADKTWVWRMDHAFREHFKRARPL